MVVPPSFTVAELAVTPSVVEDGRSVTVSFTVVNMGTVDGQYNAVVKVNGKSDRTLPLSIVAGNTIHVRFDLVRIPGSYEINIDGEKAYFTVLHRQSDLKSRPLFSCR